MTLWTSLNYRFANLNIQRNYFIMLLHWRGCTCPWGTAIDCFFWRGRLVNSRVGAGVQGTIDFIQRICNSDSFLWHDWPYLVCSYCLVILPASGLFPESPGGHRSAAACWRGHLPVPEAVELFSLEANNDASSSQGNAAPLLCFLELHAKLNQWST